MEAGKFGIATFTALTAKELGLTVVTMEGAEVGGTMSTLGSKLLRTSPPAGAGGIGGGGGRTETGRKLVASTCDAGALKIIQVASMRNRRR